MMFPPGRARLGTIPVPTGSPVPARTMGMACVALLAAITAWVEATKRSRPQGHQLGGESGSRSARPEAVRNSIARLRPST